MTSPAAEPAGPAGVGVQRAGQVSTTLSHLDRTTNMAAIKDDYCWKTEASKVASMS